MKNRFLVILIVAMPMLAAAKNVRTEYTVTNPDTVDRADMPVVINTSGWELSARVYDGFTEIPSQMDDLSGNGRPDQLAFVIDIKGGESKTVLVDWSDRREKKQRYPTRVHAQMFTKEGDVITRQDVVSANEDNMYNKLHHHGPAFESDMIAYRIYFDRKQTVDIYGKKKRGLELAETLWYPTDEQLARGMGDDIIRVFGSVGVGALKGWDPVKQQAVHIEPMERREARIVASGPVRTVVDMTVEGWQYRGRKINLQTRYILYAGHRDVEVHSTVTGDWQGITFCTGVMKMADHVHRHLEYYGIRPSGAPGHMYSTLSVWGKDYPVNDTVKYPKETVGLAVCVPGEYIAGYHEDKLNYLFELRPDIAGRMNYRMSVAAEKETFGYKDAAQFEAYVAAWAEERPAEVEKQDKQGRR